MYFDVVSARMHTNTGLEAVESKLGKADDSTLSYSSIYLHLDMAFI